MEEKENRALKDLIAKINHPLLEIRSRSLRSIVFKLRNNIIQATDLVKETSFLASLLEWFNFEEWALESQVLGLLSELSQHETAVQTLVELGGVEFLSQLRMHCDPSLHPLVDEVLEHMMMLPSNLVGLASRGNHTSPSNSTSSPNSRLTTDTTSDMGSYTPTCKDTPGPVENRTGGGASCSLPPQCMERVVPTESCVNVPHQSPSGADLAASEAAMMRPRLVGTDAHCSLAAVSGPSSRGPSNAATLQGEHPLPQPRSTDQVNWDGGGVFPWLLLSTTDHHIMATTNHRLQGGDYGKLCQCCHFIYEVLLQDYPPELFLQRPAIVHSLMGLLQRSDGHAVHVLELRCLLLLTSRLKGRLAAHLQPALRVSDRLTAGRVCAMESSSEAPQGFSDDLESWSHDLENVSPEILNHLHKEQLSLSHYCNLITEHTCSLLLECLNNDFQLGSDDDHQILQCVSSCVQLLSVTALLLSQVSANIVHMEAAVLENKLSEHVNRSVEHLGSALSHCLSKWRRMTPRDGRAPGTAPVLTCTPSMARLMVTLTTVHLAYSLSTTINVLPENASLPSTVGGALCDLVMNGLLGVSYPHLVQALLPHVKKMDPPTYQLRMKIQSYVDSFQSMFSFLRILGAKPTVTTCEVLSLAEQGLQGLYFECDEEVVSSAVELCISVLVEQGELVCQTTSRHLLLKLLSHGSFVVQRVALEHLHTSLTRSVGDSLTNELLKEDLLEGLCTRALLSTDDSVSSLCGKVLSHLLTQGGRKAVQSMAPWQLYVEAGTYFSTELAMVMHNILERGEVWSDTKKVQCLLRNMFSKNRDCRVWAFSILSKLLIAAPPSKASPFSVEQCAILHDALLLGKPSPHEQDIGRHTIFSKEDVTKLLHILRSPTMDHVLKISAIEQLAIVLLDYSLHDSALDENVISSVNSLLSCCLNDPPLSDHQATKTSSIRLFKPSVRSLGLIAHSSGLARRELAENREFLFNVLRGALLWHADVELLYDVSKLLCFLLFETVAQYSLPTKGSGIKLPEEILNRLQFPFPVDAHVTESPNKPPMMLETEVCFSEPVSGVLRLAYHTSKAGSVEALLSKVCSPTQDPALSQFEVLMLRALDCQTAFMDTTHALQSAGDQWKSTSAQLSILELIGGLHKRCGRLELDWETALQRLISVHPTTLSDEHTLESVLLFLCTAVMSPAETEWIVKAVMGPQTVCFKLMQASLQEHSERQPQKSLLRLCGNLLEQSCSIPVSYVPGLVKMFCRCLDVAGSPQYYDLPLLELSLHCVLHLSKIAMMVGKESSFEWLDCHMSAMVALRQVLCSFLVGRGSAGTTSFMGKGVSAKAAVALTHFLHSVKFQNPPQGWCTSWLKDPVCSNFGWLLSLLKDRDPHVQYGGFSILSLLCSEVDTAQIVLQEMANSTTFGIWGECLTVGLNRSEAALVRQQALGVVTSLVVLCSENKKWEDLLVLPLPQATMKGPKALRVLVDHFGLFTSFRCMLSGTEHLQSLKKACLECCSLSKAAFPAAATSLISGPLALHDPCIIWGTCQLLHNLLLPFPQYVASHILKQGLLKLVISMLTCSSEILQFTATAYDADLIRVAAFGSWLSMFEAILVLLRSLLLLHPDEILPRLLREECVGSLCHMIPCLTELLYRKSTGVGMCTALMALLHAMSYRASFHQLEMLFTYVQLQWESLVGLIQHSLGDVKNGHLHCLAVETLKLLSLFIRASCNPSDHTQTHPSTLLLSPSSGDPVKDACLGALKELLDGKGSGSMSPPELPAPMETTPTCGRSQSTHPDGRRRGSTTCGRRLCEALLRAHDELSLSVLSHPVMSALSLLVACSCTAKQAALEYGFLESSIDQLEVLHKRLNIEAMEQPSARREDSPHIEELISVVILIRNLLYRSFDSKAAALSGHLPSVIQKIWPWCCTSRRLLVSVLQLLCVFCTQHSPARAALCSGLLHSIMRLVTRYLGGMSPLAKPLGAHGDVLRAAFTLMATAALSSECRAVMRKVGLLQHLSQVNPRTEKGNQSKVKPSCLWLKLLINLSFSTEGQSMIMKTPGSLDFLVGMYWNGGGAEQTQCLLVLRNLCFHQQSKTILSTTEAVATMFSCALDSGDSRQLVLAASAIWALIFNCNKVKNSLRRSGLDKKLEQANLTCKATGFKDNPQVLNTLSTALNLLQ